LVVDIRGTVQHFPGVTYERCSASRCPA